MVCTDLALSSEVPASLSALPPAAETRAPLPALQPHRQVRQGTVLQATRQSRHSFVAGKATDSRSVKLKLGSSRGQQPRLVSSDATHLQPHVNVRRQRSRSARWKPRLTAPQLWERRLSGNQNSRHSTEAPTTEAHRWKQTASLRKLKATNRAFAGQYSGLHKESGSRLLLARSV